MLLKLEEKILGVIRDSMFDGNTVNIKMDDEFIADLSFDSIKFIGMFYLLEEELGIEIITSEHNYLFYSVTTVRDLLEVLQQIIERKL